MWINTNTADASSPVEGAMNVPRITSDSMPTMAISQPPCTTLAPCAVLRNVSTPNLK